MSHGVEGNIKTDFHSHFFQVHQMRDNHALANIFVFQLNGHDGASVFIQKSFHLLVNSFVPTTYIVQIKWIVGACSEIRVAYNPVRQSAILYFGITVRPYTQMHFQSYFFAELDKTS